MFIMCMEWEEIHISTQALDFLKLFLQKEKMCSKLGRTFDENNFRHLAGSKNYFLSHQNIFVKCPGLKKKFVDNFSSKSSRPPLSFREDWENGIFFKSWLWLLGTFKWAWLWFLWKFLLSLIFLGDHSPPWPQSTVASINWVQSPMASVPLASIPLASVRRSPLIAVFEKVKKIAFPKTTQCQTFSERKTLVTKGK